MGINIGGAIGVISGLGGIFGGGGDGDAGRKAKNEELYRLALAGDVRAEVQLRCLAGIKNDPRTLTYGFGEPSKCGWATDGARAHGQQKLRELELARKVSGIASGIVTATGGTATPAPLPNPNSPAGQAIGSSTAAPVWFWPAAIVGSAAILWYQGTRQHAGKR